jgi:type IV pilus assembly protein PilM
VIGLDIGTTRVRAVEAHQGRGAPTLVRYAEVPLPPGAVQDGEVADSGAVVHALRALWSRGRFAHRDVVLGVGNQRVLVRDLELAWMPLNQIRASLPFQVQDALPVAVEDALLDFYPTGELEGQSGRMVSGLLVAATRDTVQANVSAVESAGLRPVVVDLNAFALTRAVARDALAHRIVALVDIGAQITTVVIVDNGTPRLIRTLPSGGQHVTDAIVASLQIPVVDAEMLKQQVGVGFAVSAELEPAAEIVNHLTGTLVESIRNTLVYYAGNNPGAAADLVVLTGGGSHLSGLGQYLASASRTTVTMAEVLGAVNVARSANVGALGSTVAVPLGLALAVVQ